MSLNVIGRRDALKLTGGSLAAFTTSSLPAAGEGDAVRINVGYNAADGRKAALGAASEVVREFEFDALTVTVPEPAIAGLENDPNVEYVERDGTWQALNCGCRGCGIDSTNADESCDEGAGADVVIIDTGIQSDHPCLDSHLGVGTGCASCSGSSCGCTYTWDDDNGHGTHVAGIAAAPDGNGGVVGVSPCSTLHAVKVLNDWGSGCWSDVACGIEATANRGWDVANMSLGGSSGSSVVKDACTYAYDRGVLLVAAAGDSGSSAYPAAYDEVVAVGAVDCNGNHPSFAGGSPNTEICAPGENIYSTYTCGTHTTLSGTSMAAPHVSGVGALLMAQGYSHTQARQRMCTTACDLGLDPRYQGCGRVDADAATGCGYTC
jgi:subtilisin